MGRWRRTTACERAAQWISLELDDELEPLERAALDRHLGRCPACAAARAAVGSFTALMRAAPALGPRLPTVLAPARPRRRLRLAAAGIALALPRSAAPRPCSSCRRPRRSGTSVLASATQAQRLEFAAAEHRRIDPQPLTQPATAPPRPVISLADRALM